MLQITKIGGISLVFETIAGVYMLIGLAIFIKEYRSGELSKNVGDQNRIFTLILLLVFWPFWILDI